MLTKKSDRPLAPFVGALVHYITTQGKHLAAMIVHIYPATGLVNLCVYKDGTDYPQLTETFSVAAAKYADPKPGEAPYTWHWITDDGTQRSPRSA